MKDLPLFWDVAKNNANIYPLLAHIPIESSLTFGFMEKCEMAVQVFERNDNEKVVRKNKGEWSIISETIDARKCNGINKNNVCDSINNPKDGYFLQWNTRITKGG